MAKIQFIDFGGTARTVTAELGSTVMEAAIKKGIKHLAIIDNDP